MAGPVIFNFDAWVAMFPGFSSVSQATATMYFNMATLYVRNDGGGPIKDINMLTQMLNLTTAHLTKIFLPQAGDPSVSGVPGAAPNPLVGRITSGNQGSVSVNTEMPQQPPNASWWNQTIYGAAVWAAMKPYRMFQYIGPTKRRIFNPPYGWWSGSGGWGFPFGG